MKELTKVELEMIAGGDRNLGSLYQYTGNESDRTTGEKFWEGVGKMADKLWESFEQSWR